MRPRSKAEPGSNGSYFFQVPLHKTKGKREKMSYDGSLKFDTSIDASADFLHPQRSWQLQPAKPWPGSQRPVSQSVRFP